MNQDVDEDICNGYVEDLEKIMDDLDDYGHEWIYKVFDEIEILRDGLFSSISDKDIDDKMNECYNQLKRILQRLAVDPDEIINKKRDSSPHSNVPHITVHNTLSQTQENNNSSQNIQFQRLKDDFEEELNKSNPDKSKLKSIIERIISMGKPIGWMVDIFLK